MTIELHPNEDGKILRVRASGHLTKEDYEHFVPEVERLIGQHGTVRVLFDMHEFHGWSAGALWEDIKFDLKHFGDIERLAMVGERTWEQGMAVFCKPFTKAKIRYFDRQQAEDALTWLREG